ncbi:MAG: type II secretion system F family protein [Spirochaetaceae bacterium]|nr:type II secretion system F family protein [Spirochaetaceae bacterium]
MTGRRLAAALALAALAVGVTAGPASAEGTGRVVEVSVEGRTLQLLFQADGLADDVLLDPASVSVDVDGVSVPATAVPVEDDSRAVLRTSVLAFDNSRSMIGAPLEAAKAAATTFLTSVPPDVAVGLVTFGATANVAEAPTRDRSVVQNAVDGLAVDDTTGTALFDAAALAMDATGGEGFRSVVLLTDGNEDGSSELSLTEAIGHATDDGVTVDAVYISDGVTQPPELQELIAGAGGQVVTAGTVDLASVFAGSARAIANQLSVSATLPEGAEGSGTVTVRALAGESQLADGVFARLSDPDPAPRPSTDNGPRALDTTIPDGALLAEVAHSPATLRGALAAIFIALLGVLLVALGSLRRDDQQGRVRRRLSIYTLTGRTPARREKTTSTALGGSQVARSAVDLANRVVAKRDFEAGLALRLESAGVPLRAAEWIIIHVGAAVGAAMLALLISGAGILPTALGLAVGLGLPFGYLIVKESRRTSAFLAQLPDTLQLIAGSLSAGYSMPQAIDTVVREAAQPIAAEFNRALVEARLGVPIEDALDRVAERMHSRDFGWVVMAVRIQREVGGNLAELLTTVSATLRERERLRRQVKVLSAEGRLSAWILGLLPPVFSVYLLLTQPSYLKPLVTEALGILLLGLGLTLLAVGVLWMRKAIKVEV